MLVASASILCGSEVVAERSTGLDPFIVERETLDEQLAEPSRCPLPERRATGRPDAIADGENGIEVVVIDEAGNLPFAFGLNYPEFPDSCPGIKLAFVVNVDEMLICRFDRDLE